jgi:hypothetical protein
MLSGQRGAKQSRQGNRKRRERGGALVEFAIVSPLVFLLLLGSVEFGIQFNDYQSLRSGVRDAARVASVARVPDTCSPTTSATDDLVCYVKQRIGLGANTAVKVDVTAPNGAIYGDRGDIKICVERSANSITGLFRPFLGGRYLRSEVTMRVERGNAPAYIDYAETAPSGGWSC